MRASFVHHMISVVLGLIATIYLLYILMIQRSNMKPFQIATLLFLLSITWAIECIIHFAEEFIYDFDPLAGKMEIKTEPMDRNKFLGIF